MPKQKKKSEEKMPGEKYVLLEKAEELHDIKEQMMELLDRARDVVKGTPEENAAESYWIAHIRISLDDDHEFLGESMCNMQDTIDALEELGGKKSEEE